jgi:YgiT-type zinc finger domain-containing protein
MVIEAKMPNENSETSQQYVGLCPECQTGVMRLEYLTYFTWLNEELVTVPNFPAWVCDICGRREYDSRAITWLNTLLSPDTGRRRITTRQKPPHKGIDQPHIQE